MYCIESVSIISPAFSVAPFIATIRKKAQDEYEKYYDIGHREWYDKDDESWKKDLPRPGKDYPTGR